MNRNSAQDPKVSTGASAGAFVAAAALVFVSSLSAAHSVGFVPYYVDGTEPRRVAVADLPELGPSAVEGTTAVEVTPEEAGVLPERIVIPAIDLDLPVQNVESRDLAVLDEALKDGPVRHMDSALLGEKGNMLVFGHSSHLPVVKNQMYKAFNDIPELSAGDLVKISGGGREYHYRVVSLKQVETDDADAVIDLSRGGVARLTIVTCDTLTGKTSRFVLETELIARY